MTPRALPCVCAGAVEDRSKRGQPPGNEASDARIRSFTFTLDLSGERWEYLRLLVGFAGDLGISLCFFKFSLFICSWLCWDFIAAWLFSSCGGWGALSSSGVQASLCSGLSCCGTQALGRSGF